MKTITKQQARTLLANIANDGVFFGATVKRRRNGEPKDWNAKSIADTFNDRDQENDLMTVFDAKAGHPKSIALEGVQQIRCYGETFRVGSMADGSNASVGSSDDLQRVGDL